MKRLLTTTAIVAMSALPLAAEQHSGAKTEMSVTVGENEVRISNLMDATVYIEKLKSEMEEMKWIMGRYDRMRRVK